MHTYMYVQWVYVCGQWVWSHTHVHVLEDVSCSTATDLSGRATILARLWEGWRMKLILLHTVSHEDDLLHTVSHFFSRTSVLKSTRSPSSGSLYPWELDGGLGGEWGRGWGWEG